MQETSGVGREWAGGLGLLAVLAAGGALLARWTSPPGAAVAAGVTAGVAAVLLLSFSASDLARAVACAAGGPADPATRRRAAAAWRTAAWSAWTLAAAGAVVAFVAAFASDSGGIARFLAGLGDRAAGVASGLLLAILLALPALRLAAADGGPAETAPPPRLTQRLLALVFLLALFAAPVVGRGSGGRFEPVPWLLHAPAWLLVVGGAVAVALYLSDRGRGTAAVLGLTAAGAVGVGAGLARGLHGFATVNIDDVAGGLMFAISSAYSALAGLAVAGLPLAARDTGHGRRDESAVRAAVLGFPLLVLVLLSVTILLALVPMEKAAG
jgi:hypothetical protein